MPPRSVSGAVLEECLAAVNRTGRDESVQLCRISSWKPLDSTADYFGPGMGMVLEGQMNEEHVSFMPMVLSDE